MFVMSYRGPRDSFEGDREKSYRIITDTSGSPTLQSVLGDLELSYFVEGGTLVITGKSWGDIEDIR
jgi:hypothetical protein